MIPTPLRPPCDRLELRLGDSSASAKGTFTTVLTSAHAGHGESHDLVLELGTGTAKTAEQDNQKTHMQPDEDDEARCQGESPFGLRLSCSLLPAVADRTGSVTSEVSRRGFDVNNVLLDEDAVKMKSLSTSSLQLEVPLHQAADQEGAEDEENGGVGGVRKKLRLSKEQSALLEDSFKVHSTLTPEQKSDLARRLNLRPRQVEVWFQNRRARSKLKQTEEDCKYLKRCCATLTHENRRLQREVAELRALRATYPFYSHQPAAGFSATRGCPSCDDKAAPYSVVTAVSSSSVVAPPPPSMSTLFARPYLGPFTMQPVLSRHPSATS